MSFAPEIAGIPETIDLLQNYPNPFNPSTVMRYQLPVSSDVSLVIYNLRGQLVRTLIAGEMPAGFHTIRWDALNDHGVRVPTGLYVYKLIAGEKMMVRKMLLVK